MIQNNDVLPTNGEQSTNGLSRPTQTNNQTQQTSPTQKFGRFERNRNNQGHRNSNHSNNSNSPRSPLTTPNDSAQSPLTNLRPTVQNQGNRFKQRSGGSRGRGGFNNAPKGPKTNSVSSLNPHYMVKRSGGEDSVVQALGNIESVRNLRNTGVKKGNLSMSHTNPVLYSGPNIETNSPEIFENGPIVKIIPLGGTQEVGMNMTAIECGDDIVVIDTGFGFGGNDKFPGVDYIVPDTSYLEQNRHKLRGVIFTHGHLDHIGGAPYVLPKLGQVPIFGMPLTLALLKNRLQEFEMSDKYVGKVIDIEKPLKLGNLSFSFFRLNHSIPDVVGLCIDTPMGRIVYATDWKFDSTPFDGKLSDYAKLAQYGSEGVRLLMTDSLGILKPGFAISESDIGKTITKVFEQSQGRIIFTTFSTTIARIQHTINACEKTNRKLAIIGRSMINNFNVCFQLGYIRVPNGLVIDPKEVANFAPEQICILTTGSQGEDNAALNRMARDEHDQIKLQAGDSVIFSSKPIPGNESAVQDLVAKLSAKGVDVYKSPEFDLHVSGHACVEELKLLIALTKPAYLMPIHGDHYMLRKLGELGQKMGIPFENNLLVENCRITELRPNEIFVSDEVVGDSYVLVDGTGVGAVSEVVLEERRQMATQGAVMIVVLVNKQKKLIGGPEIISRGFVYMKNSSDLFEEIKGEIKKKFDSIKFDPDSKTAWTDLRNGIRQISRDFIVDKTEKDPTIIPVVVQV
jgi:ribonuclease J